MTTFNIKPTIAEEAMESWVWTNDASISSKGFIVIKNPTNGNKIKTFKRTIDDNFVKIYNQHNTNKIEINSDKTYLILNEYYRDILGLDKNIDIKLAVTKATFLEKIFLVHWTHPNPTVQFANRATLVSILIGIVALILTIYSIYITISPITNSVCPHN
ncbi:MAG: hypothetical protein IPK61_17605 [Saprospiraceae bacterium]|nr:hypothetical protein [Saprospiraceae bacterium]MBK9379276.1 hypothetical protein [Saprospiraceae bacterium]